MIIFFCDEIYLSDDISFCGSTSAEFVLECFLHFRVVCDQRDSVGCVLACDSYAADVVAVCVCLLHCCVSSFRCCCSFAGWVVVCRMVENFFSALEKCAGQPRSHCVYRNLFSIDTVAVVA